MSFLSLSTYNPLSYFYSESKQDDLVSLPISSGIQVEDKEPQIFVNDPALAVRMEEYLVTCPGISSAEMKSMVCRGEEIERLISNCIFNKRKLSSKVRKSLTSRDAVCLMWLLMVKAGQQNKLHISGAFRIDDPRGLIFDFLKACGKENCYGRISTHMAENLGPMEGQWGLDVRDQKLPAEKHTILFAQQPDQTLYLKIEESGCPPFWQYKHCSYANALEFMGHTSDYIITRVLEKPKLIKKTFREDVPTHVKELFVKAMNDLYEKSPDLQASEKEEGIRKGKTFGISEMYQQLKSAHSQAAGSDSVSDEGYIPCPIRERIVEAAMLGYKGAIKGEEIILPRLGVPVDSGL
ncbi:Conserved hypothetical protein [Candidatus Protochlamydia naegleriophila]|uniref:Uncharacterized protein n=1 Tax=Candidatus Protochlamydia naegleriophila TaxID=389348 RepID=A0A0U5EQH4_9BACT|nr:hypothetical protein [Candidatus Protochlamydia naegleriophila]CUI16387.1 Conserved hypothetical protein [Candidatus Protochlamydia naegleriophila]